MQEIVHMLGGVLRVFPACPLTSHSHPERTQKTPAGRPWGGHSEALCSVGEGQAASSPPPHPVVLGWAAGPGVPGGGFAAWL